MNVSLSLFLSLSLSTALLEWAMPRFEQGTFHKQTLSLFLALSPFLSIALSGWGHAEVRAWRILDKHSLPFSRSLSLSLAIS